MSVVFYELFQRGVAEGKGYEYVSPVDTTLILHNCPIEVVDDHYVLHYRGVKMVLTKTTFLDDVITKLQPSDYTYNKLLTHNFCYGSRFDHIRNTLNLVCGTTDG